ncbi:ClpXP protease specificity-enhancing factor [Colwellia sp. RSH04]|uniref:ClpXP protease specificity-enhancing factor n=1 Tax=Colwellia sp. RSH04 TaxID=2305464 RepID=UPI000E58C552|nr:ClpXP protease specificity-enhancing factor [Colwellia sp. RSH04]RHW76692.1 ClpXP protease specificity-enhancing factor [Colwellia sp. RSH04]
MSGPTLASMSSNKPYLVKAFYEWISDNDLTPYIVVDVNVYGVLVPMNYVADGQIVLNIASSAVGSIVLGPKEIEFSARFGGKLEQLTIPYGAIGAIYAKENGAGTSLPIEHPDEDELTSDELIESVPEKTLTKPKASLSSVSSSGNEKPSKEDSKNKKKGKPSLKIIK